MEVLIKNPDRTRIIKRVVNVSDSACCWIFVFNSKLCVYYKNIIATNKKCQRVINDVPSRDVFRSRNGNKNELPKKKGKFIKKYMPVIRCMEIRKGMCLARGLLLPITWSIDIWCMRNYIVSYQISFFSVNTFPELKKKKLRFQQRNQIIKKSFNTISMRFYYSFFISFCLRSYPLVHLNFQLNLKCYVSKK